MSNGNQQQSDHTSDSAKPSRWPLRIDHREVKSRLVQIAGDSGLFEVQLASLKAGDYVVNRRVVVERKTHLDLVLSILDGRLFAQAAALQLPGQRSLFLVEGPRPARLPRVHPDAIKGALLSLAVSWRLPVVFSRDPEDSLKCLQMLAEQSQALSTRRLTRAGPRPKGDLRRRMFLLQGLPGIGPSLAQRLLAHFGSVEKILLADANLLLQVDGCGPKTAAAIRSVVAGAARPPY